MADASIAAEIAGIELTIGAIQSIVSILAQQEPEGGLAFALEVLVDRAQESINALKERGGR